MSRDMVIAARSLRRADDYDARLDRVLELPEPTAHDHLVVRRFQRRRLRRRRDRLDSRTVTTRGGIKA